MYYLALTVLVLLLSILWFFPVAIYRILLRLFVLLSPFKQKSVSLENGQHCVYIEKGNAEKTKKTILLLHGFSATCIGYLKVGKKFDNSYHVIAIDWLNHGSSAKVKGLVKLDEAVNFVRMFVKKVGLTGRKLHLVGHSTGGYIAVHYAIKYPQECASVSMLAPLGVLITEVLDIDKFCSPKNKEEVNNLIDLVSNGKLSLLPSYFMYAARLFRCSMAESHLQVYHGFIKNAKFTADDMKKLSNIPSILIWGDTDKLLPTKVGIDFFKENSPTTEIHILKDAGHAIIDTDADEVYRLLQSWFERNSTI
ncbi:monoacylglycerol lipase ABHD6 isoform X2 [Hydra vulgaris]|uniref:acylglycerol lipase n=1 Tax=Hydra vulgaris TaxID=6087 RepID=A0ABM4CKF0_HYDVU